MASTKSIPSTRNRQPIIPAIFHLLLACLISLPTYMNLYAVSTINWMTFLLLILWQFLLTQVYLLFSKQKGLTLIKNMVVLAIVEVALIAILFFSPVTILVKGLLFLQWLLIHLVIGTHNLLPILPPLFIAMEMVIMQNIVEMANAQVLLTGLGFINFLFYLAVFTWLSSLFIEYRLEGIEIAGKKSNTSRIMKLLAIFAVISLIIAIALSFMITDGITGSNIALIVISVMIMVYSLFLKKNQ
ncbi:hypothetical protein ACW66K_06230 [Aerococcus urinaeequi]|uniref:Uncharacterized protein n=1 Tax=Aerococcus viridans TaxID=1377 RepID=A0A2N6UCN7_9LACT|nr:hypothetical protein [Aerococcus viridans]PMC79343.1 hypothetical protein CJ191_07405 [Aerococcus viridans]